MNSVTALLRREHPAHSDDEYSEGVQLKSPPSPTVARTATLAPRSATAQAAVAGEAAADVRTTPREVFSQMDADLVRVLEDLVYVLIDKGVISLHDLPPHAQAKLLQRHTFRERFSRQISDSRVGDFVDALDDSRFGLMR